MYKIELKLWENHKRKHKRWGEYVMYQNQDHTDFRKFTNNKPTHTLYTRKQQEENEKQKCEIQKYISMLISHWSFTTKIGTSSF